MVSVAQLPAGRRVMALQGNKELVYCHCCFATSELASYPCIQLCCHLSSINLQRLITLSLSCGV